MNKHTDIIGQKFGKLTVLGLHHKKQVYQNGKKDGWKYYYTCLCDCGKITISTSRDLKYGHAKSCGCTNIERISKINKTHGLSNTRLYRIWKGMKRRCFNRNNPKHERYGKRGITVCPEWRDDFMSFYNWAIKNGYEDNLSIDRIDNNGDYCPENCRWATPKEQSNNTGRNNYITYNGETHTLAEWARIIDVAYGLLSSRLNRCCWTVEEAFTTPARKITIKVEGLK